MKVCPLLVCNEGFKSEFTDEGSLEYLSSLFSFLCITWGEIKCLKVRSSMRKGGMTARLQGHS